MMLLAFFSSTGTPKTGLTPGIKIVDAADGAVKIDTTMSEIEETNAPGWYKYDFTTYDVATDYVMTADGGSALAVTERYRVATNELAVAQFVRLMEEGKWEITDEDGGTMIFYKDDNTTEIARFALYDENGVRTDDPTKIVRRDRL